MKLEKSLAYKYDREISMNDVCFICISELLLQAERALVEATCTLHCVLCTYLSAFTGYVSEALEIKSSLLLIFGSLKAESLPVPGITRMLPFII